MQRFNTLALLAALAASLAAPVRASAAEASKTVTLYKNPQCGCCEEYAKYLRKNGFEVNVVASHDLSLINKEHGVPEALEGCHTSLIDGYVVEGHVPVASVNKLLTERPAIKGISLPGMPTGTPGMGGPKTGPFTIYEIGPGEPKVFATE